MNTSTRRWTVLVGGLAVLAAAGGYFYRGLKPAPESFPPDLSLKDFSGQPHVIGDWHGKLVLVNFWASWCGPCVEEMPDLLKAQHRYGVRGMQVVGIAVDDPDDARKTLKDLGIDYPVLTGSPEALMDLMQKLGNDAGGLPFSVWVDTNGHIVDHVLGQLGEADFETMSKKYLPQG